MTVKLFVFPFKHLHIHIRKLMQEYGSNQQDRYAYKMMAVISRFYKVLLNQ